MKTARQDTGHSVRRTIATPRPTWRTRLANWAFGLKPADTILEHRAADLVERLHLARYLQPRGVYVDIGSGTGHNSVRMARVARGFQARFVCVEPVGKPTRRVLKRMKKRTDGRVQFVRALGNCLPLPDNHADGVSVFFVLHHIPYPVQLDVLAEIQRVLKPGGLLFVWEDTPNNRAEYASNEIWDRRLNFEPRHEAHYYRSGDQWLSLFSDQGLKVIQTAYYEDHSRRAKEGLIRHTGFVLRYDGGT